MKRPCYAHDDTLPRQIIVVPFSSDPLSANNGVFYYLTNHLGSTSMLFNRSTSIVAGGSEARYLPFGGWRTTPSQTISERGYTGQVENMELGLYYYNARYYVPGIGRFASADTIVPEPGSPQSFNRYAYSYNNPVTYTDPSGHCAVASDGNIALDDDGNLLKTDCTIQDFQNLTWAQRVQWMQYFIAQNKLGEWFDDILGAISILSCDPDYQDMQGWAAYADAGVLQAINDGMRLYGQQMPIGSAISDGRTYSLVHGGRGWARFFSGFYSGMEEENQNGLIALRFAAEQDGVNYAAFLPESRRRYAEENGRTQIKIDLFLWGANQYRSIGQWCRTGYGCNSVYTDPRGATETRLFGVLGQLPGPTSYLLYSLTVVPPTPVMAPSHWH